MTAINYRNHRLPPNGYPISSNFFCDRTEAKNIDWLEYEFWTGQIFGTNSSEYYTTKLDTLAWGETDTCLSEFGTYYLRHPAYRDYPVVGMSHQQALQFSKWRSDRVLEHILTITNTIEYDSIQNAHTYFTIEKYYSGNYNNTIPNLSIPYLNYRLPTSNERTQILKYSDSLRLHQKRVKKPTELYSTKYGTVICLIPLKSDSCRFNWIPIQHVYKEYGKKTFEVLSHLRGNACEWSIDSTICFGGSWNTPMDLIIQNDTFLITDSSNIFTGFRNVGEWKYWNKN